MSFDASSWKTNPTAAYADWQEREAAGADRRAFAAQSIVQHRAMFERFNRHLVSRGLTLATFGATDLEQFLVAGGEFREDTTTRIRYAKLVDRLCRHLVDVGVRRENPGFDLVQREYWPTTEPDPVYLSEHADARLQAYVQPLAGDDERATRKRAMVGLLLATGVTVSEFLRLATTDVWLASALPYVTVAAHAPRPLRTVLIDRFAVPILTEWLTVRTTYAERGPLLFPKPDGKPFTVASIGNYVRDALLAIEAPAADMSPRVLRNTDCRRQLLADHTNEEVSSRLGLTSQRTCERLRLTIDRHTTAE
jgi:site-specific recombinase XerD